MLQLGEWLSWAPGAAVPAAVPAAALMQAVRSGRIDLRKLVGEEDPADLFTKHLLTSSPEAQ